MLGRSELASQGPFSVKGDFVEAPSQLLENWCWEYDALKTFARHYKTGKTLPPALYEKMKNSKLALTGLNNMRQLYFGTIDFTFHDKYDSINSKSLTSVSKSLTDMVQIPYVEGSHLICSFGHLNGYAANYYGYMWSRVFAEDMFSVFKKEGVMNSRTGIRYRQQVLEKGSTMDEIEMLKNFLGRSPNSNAFMQSLGLKPSYTLDNTKK
jgi:Zn-dependent oligopeptidase